LLTRSEVDPRHVGITGNSGGGTLTTWLCGWEQRWTMAAPSCFVTTFRRDLENELPQDTEQCPPRALALGLNHEDFLAALAPKPVIILEQEKDYFDVRGTEEAFARLKRLYGLLGPKRTSPCSSVQLTTATRGRTAKRCISGFNRVTGISDAKTEPALVLEKDETLYCTPRGQLLEPKPRTVYSFTKQKSQELARRRQSLPDAALRETLAAVLKLPPRTDVPDYRILRSLPARKYPQRQFVHYAVETEPNIESIVVRLADEPLLSRPPRGILRAVLYVAHLSSDAELRDEPLLGQLLLEEPDAAFYACDPRGTGESRPNTCGQNQFFQPYGSDFFYAAYAIMLDSPLIGQKTYDVLRLLDWLVSLGHREIHLAGRGWGAIPAALAAVLSDAVVQVTLKNALTSYSAVAESEDYRWPLSALLPGVLEKFDLPDVYRALAAKKLRQLEPWGAAAG